MEDDLIFVLDKNNWSFSAPYTYGIIMGPETDNYDYELVGFESTGDPDLDAIIAEQYEYISYGVTVNGIAIFIAYSYRPTVNIPVILRRINMEEPQNESVIFSEPAEQSTDDAGSN